jgi:hypothetical protein
MRSIKSQLSDLAVAGPDGLRLSGLVTPSRTECPMAPILANPVREAPIRLNTSEPPSQVQVFLLLRFQSIDCAPLEPAKPRALFNSVAGTRNARP